MSAIFVLRGWQLPEYCLRIKYLPVRFLYTSDWCPHGRGLAEVFQRVTQNMPTTWPLQSSKTHLYYMVNTCFLIHCYYMVSWSTAGGAYHMLHTWLCRTVLSQGCSRVCIQATTSLWQPIQTCLLVAWSFPVPFLVTSLWWGTHRLKIHRLKMVRVPIMWLIYHPVPL